MTTTISGFSILDRHFNCSSELITTERFLSVTIAFGSMFGWAGVPYSMHYFRIQQVGLTRVPRSEAGYWWLQWTNIELPAYLVRDPLIVRYDPYVWVGTEALVAWATMEDFPDRSFDELMTAKNYIDKELVHLPNAPKFVGQFFPVMKVMSRVCLVFMSALSGLARFGSGLGRELRNLFICLTTNATSILTQSSSPEARS
jgi:hypothetical protein